MSEARQLEHVMTQLRQAEFTMTKPFWQLVHEPLVSHVMQLRGQLTQLCCVLKKYCPGGQAVQLNGEPVQETQMESHGWQVVPER